MKVLAIGSHPDDIEYGCGGTLYKFSRKNYKVHLLVMSKGEVGGKAEVRKTEQNKVAKVLNAKIHWGDFEDTKIMVNRQSINFIENIITEVKPDIIFINYFDDTHQDHRHVSQSSMTASRHLHNVLFYEVPTTINFHPTVFTDICDILDIKMKLLKFHKSQVYDTKVPGLNILDSAKSCAIFRGFQDRLKYAEGFVPLRMSIKI